MIFGSVYLFSHWPLSPQGFMEMAGGFPLVQGSQDLYVAKDFGGGSKGELKLFLGIPFLMCVCLYKLFVLPFFLFILFLSHSVLHFVII